MIAYHVWRLSTFHTAIYTLPRPHSIFSSAGTTSAAVERRSVCSRISRMTKISKSLYILLLLALLAHQQAFVGATSSHRDQPSTRDPSTQCTQTSKKPSECGDIFQRTLLLSANSSSLPTDTLLLQPHLAAADVNVSCESVVTAWECYYTHTPCHSARDTQLPVCSQQCRELTRQLKNCHSSFEAVLSWNATSGPSLLLDKLLKFVEELNCSVPDSFRRSHLPVDEDNCTNLYLTLAEMEGNNRLPEIIVLCLIVGVSVCLIVLLLLILSVVVVGLRRKKRKGKSRVGCSQQSNSVTTLRRLDSPNPSATIDTFPSSEEVNARNDVQVARMITDRKRRHYVSLYTGSFIPYQHLELLSVIGEGAFGKVSEGVWRDPSTNIEKRVAIKTLRSFSSEQQLNTLFTESRAMRDFDHPNVMKFLGMCFDSPEGYPYIILQFMSNGSLLDYLKRKSSSSSSNPVGGFPEGLELEVLFQFCLDVVDGMSYLVQQKFVHRDLAARNCMVSDTKTILIGDFGLAEDLYSTDQRQNTARLPVKWMPPESLRDGISNERTDMWSYGVTCWEVFSLGRSPYPGIENHEILQHISSGGRLKKPTLCPEKLYEVVGGCWQYNPRDRPSFEEMALTLRQFWNVFQSTT